MAQLHGFTVQESTTFPQGLEFERMCRIYSIIPKKFIAFVCTLSSVQSSIHVFT
eukprot:m.908401 g.908401  ORF g.908401 m.908401 type:complete len:54 (-) comp23713_c0_seq2:1591-1752(-)